MLLVSYVRGEVISWLLDCFLRSWRGNFVGYLFLTFVERSFRGLLVGKSNQQDSLTLNPTNNDDSTTSL